MIVPLLSIDAEKGRYVESLRNGRVDWSVEMDSLVALIREERSTHPSCHCELEDEAGCNMKA